MIESDQEVNWSYQAVMAISKHKNDWHTDKGSPHLPNDEYHFDEYYVDVANDAFRVLEALCTDVRANRSRDGQLGWLDVDVVFRLEELDTMAQDIVPPERADASERNDVNERLHDFRTALPWSAGERRWLMNQTRRVYGAKTRAEALKMIEAQEGEVMSEGQKKPVSGIELLERFHRWRRQESDYEDGAGVDQARTALAGLISLLRPQMGLPAEFEELRPGLGRLVVSS